MPKNARAMRAVPNQVVAENSPAYVLDSYALLSYLQAEPGGEIVRDLLSASARDTARLFLSIINAGEVYYLMARERGLDRADGFLRDLRTLPILIVEATQARVLAAARVKARHPIAYADAFAASLATELRASLVTGDREFESVESSVKILWLARR